MSVGPCLASPVFVDVPAVVEMPFILLASSPTAAFRAAPVGSLPINAATVVDPKMFKAAWGIPNPLNASPVAAFTPAVAPAPSPAVSASCRIFLLPVRREVVPLPIAAARPLLAAASRDAIPVLERFLGIASLMVEPKKEVAPLVRPAFAISPKSPPKP
jgi:hypothetical protein